MPEPVTMAEKISDPAYLKFIWARYLTQEATHRKAQGRRTIQVSAEGAEELARLLTP